MQEIIRRSGKRMIVDSSFYKFSIQKFDEVLTSKCIIFNVKSKNNVQGHIA